MKRFAIILMALSILLTGCSAPQALKENKQYRATFLNLFDTVTTMVGPADSEEQFKEIAQKIHDDLEVYHQLFDIYHNYEGIANIKTINDNAGKEPVKVDPIIIELLKDCRRFYDMTGGKTNVALGSVLYIWHVYRTEGYDEPENAKLPPMDKLQAASEHTSFDDVVIDEENCTVMLKDPKMRLDVGAVAKGWAAQRVAERAPKGMLISVGGNICATGPKKEDGTPWVIGVQDPDDSTKNIHTVYVTGGSVVTSGDYQRAYWVDGVRYHHIIDPETLMPADHYRAVTLLVDDSGLADALSTALYIIPLEESMKLANELGIDAYWICNDGTEAMTDGFKAKLKE